MRRKFSYLRFENLKKYPSCHYNFEYFKKKNKNNKKNIMKKKMVLLFLSFTILLEKF